MNRTVTKILGSAALTLMLVAQPTVAAPSSQQQPSAIEMGADMIIARPVQLASTVVGAAIFIVSLPFTVLGDNVGQAGETLVVAPAKATFARCLGCTR